MTISALYIVMFTVISLLILHWAWNRSPLRRKRFLGTDAPDVFHRLQLDDKLSFEALHASAEGEVAGHLYKVDIRLEQVAKLPYGYTIALSFQIPNLLPPSVSIYREERPTGITLRESVNVQGATQKDTREYVTLAMPRADYLVEFDPIIAFAFGEPGQRFVTRVISQGLILESLRIDERLITFEVSVDVATQSYYDLKNDEKRRAFLASSVGKLTELIGQFQTTSRQPLELYGAAFSAIPAEHEDWAGLADYLFVQHADSPVTRTTWAELIAQRNLERMYRLIMQFPERMYESLQHEEVIEVISVLIDQSLYNVETHILELAEHLAPSLEPFVLYASELPISFRMKVLKLWLAAKTYRAEELAPAIAQMRDGMSMLERKRLKAMAEESSLRGGLSSVDSTQQGALTASDEQA